MLLMVLSIPPGISTSHCWLFSPCAKALNSHRLKNNSKASGWPIFTPTNPTEADEISKKIEEKLIKQLSEQTNESNQYVQYSGYIM